MIRGVKHIIPVKLHYYIDTDEMSGFFLLLKNHIFIARSKDTIPWFATTVKGTFGIIADGIVATVVRVGPAFVFI